VLSIFFCAFKLAALQLIVVIPTFGPIQYFSHENAKTIFFNLSLDRRSTFLPFLFETWWCNPACPPSLVTLSLYTCIWDIVGKRWRGFVLALKRGSVERQQIKSEDYILTICSPGSPLPSPFTTIFSFSRGGEGGGRTKVLWKIKDEKEHNPFINIVTKHNNSWKIPV
jgi:hypothetical protein